MPGNNDWNNSYQVLPLQVHRDQRGLLFEALRFMEQRIPTGGQLYVYTVEPGARRGDHYHEQKGEWFTCVHGRVRVLMKTSAGEVVDEVVDGEAPQMIYAAPGTAHAVVNDDDAPAVIIAYASKEFDPEHPDTVVMRADSSGGQAPLD